MRATNLTWRNAIYRRTDDEGVDLHNDYDFRRLAYESCRQRLVLEWALRLDNPALEEGPGELVLRLGGVTQFSFTERDSTLP